MKASYDPFKHTGNNFIHPSQNQIIAYNNSH